MVSADAPTLDRLKRLGVFTVAAEGEAVQSALSTRRAVYAEWAAGYKVNGAWAERIGSGHSGRPVTLLTPSGRGIRD